MRRRALAHALLGVLVGSVAGCGGHGELAAGVRDTTFVAVMAELQRIDQSETLDSAGRQAARAVALQSRGLTRAQLEQAASSLAQDPERALELFRAIETRAAGDSARQDSTAAPRRQGLRERLR